MSLYPNSLSLGDAATAIPGLHATTVPPILVAWTPSDPAGKEGGNLGMGLRGLGREAGPTWVTEGSGSPRGP